MQHIMDQYTTLHEAKDGKIQQDKIISCYWKQHCCNAEKMIKQVEAELVVQGEQTRSIQIKTSTRTLGMHLAPALEWKGQFEVMRKKLHMSITKLMDVDTNPYEYAIYFNVHVITYVCFRMWNSMHYCRARKRTKNNVRRANPNEIRFE